MPTTVLVLVLVLGVAAPSIAHGAQVFAFDWTSVVSFSTLVPVNRVEADGSITPFDQRTASGTRSGHGVLTLTQPEGFGGGYRFEFAGTGGEGFGRSDADGSIMPGGISVPVPADVPLTGSRPYVGGRVELIGDPARPSGVSISYLDAASPHCVFECSTLEFRGTGRSIVGASEPSPVLVLALALVAGAATRACLRGLHTIPGKTR